MMVQKCPNFYLPFCSLKTTGAPQFIEEPTYFLPSANVTCIAVFRRKDLCMGGMGWRQDACDCLPIPNPKSWFQL